MNLLGLTATIILDTEEQVKAFVNEVTERVKIYEYVGFYIDDYPLEPGVPFNIRIESFDGRDMDLIIQLKELLTVVGEVK